MRISATLRHGPAHEVELQTGEQPPRPLAVPPKPEGGGSAVNGGEFLMLAGYGAFWAFTLVGAPPLVTHVRWKRSPSPEGGFSGSARPRRWSHCAGRPRA